MPGICRKCGADLPEAAGPGRPRAYCSTGCRRAAEYEAKRINKAIEEVEEQVRWCRFGWYSRTKRDIPKYQEELWRLEARLRAILNDDALRP
jgi:ribosomal protein L40E